MERSAMGIIHHERSWAKSTSMMIYEMRFRRWRDALDGHRAFVRQLTIRCHAMNHVGEMLAELREKIL